jgi:hypothetical protein
VAWEKNDKEELSIGGSGSQVVVLQRLGSDRSDCSARRMEETLSAKNEANESAVLEEEGALDGGL